LVSDDFHEGARSGHPEDICPLCHVPGCIIASDFKAMGAHRVKFCLACRHVSDNGHDKGPIDVHEEES